MLDQFVAQWLNKPLEVEDASALDQCMDLAFAWADFIGLSRSEIRNPFAKNVWANHGPNVVPTSTPTAGDFVIWGTAVGPAGHIAVFLAGNPNSFTSFDQNWNFEQRCLKVTHNNFGVLGFLHPTNLGGSVATVTISTDEYQDLKNWKATATDPANIVVPKAVLTDAQNWKDYAINTLQPEVDDLNKKLANATSSDAAKKLQEIADLINGK